MSQTQPTDFAALVQDELDKIADILDRECEDFAEAEFQGDVLTVTLKDSKQFVLNRNIVHRQLWLSSPFSGAWHFSYDENEKRWISTRGTEKLHEILSAEFSKLTGHEVQF